MLSKLERHEQLFLQDYLNFSDQDSQSSVTEKVESGYLFQPQILNPFLQRLGTIMDSKQRVATASQFAKRYSFSLLTPCLYAMSVYNKGFDFSAGNCLLVEGKFVDKWIPKFSLLDRSYQIPKKGERAAWRNQILTHLFHHHIVPMWAAVHHVAKVPWPILKENTVIYVYWLYQQKLAQENHDPATISRIEEDWHALHSSKVVDWFPDDINPMFAPRTSIRKTCCLHYCVGEKPVYCSSCPKKRVSVRTQNDRRMEEKVYS